MKKLWLLFAGGLFICSSYAQISLTTPDIHPDLVPLLDESMAPFYHGVASGDPTTSSVIIWTKISLPKYSNTPTEPVVKYEMATDSLFDHMIQSGTQKATFGANTVKVDVTGLSAGKKYYYRFAYEGTYSIVGQTCTLPKNPKKYSIAFAACSNYEWGYFNNYRSIANDPDVELVVHLGDYIYEYAPGKYGDTTIGRINVPDHEIISLDDYRTRYSLYRLDKDLIRLHQMKPFITTWDDHEIANNGYVEGAQNHQSDEGDWQTRKSWGKQAYYEWMPVRDNAYHELYRSFKIGNLFDLIILDTRIAGRSKQVDSPNDANFNDTDRTILGKEQYDWMIDRISDKSTTWKIIGNQVPFGPLKQPDFNGNADLYMDGWDGYPYERKKLLKRIEQQGLKNIVFVTGDYHVSFAMENDLNGTADDSDNLATEFVVTSITSANDDEGIDRNMAIAFQKDYLQFNPNCKYVNNVDHGYIVVTITSTKVTCHFYYADTVRQKSTQKRKERTFEVKKGKNKLIEK